MTFLPLSADEFERLMEPYALEGTLVVAVSGGADSLALVLLMQEWATAKSIKIIGVTIDHQLRPDSAEEAALVHQWLERRGIEHHTLIWRHSGVTSDLQQKARKARYDLLVNWCRLGHATALLTAHHFQDQWETFLMRLSKGSGLTGLCGIKLTRNLNGLRLIRPLLQVRAERLERTVERFNQPFIRDPSNHNLKYARVRFRQLFSALSNEGLTPETLDRVRKRFQTTEDYLEQQLKIAIAECVIEERIHLASFKTLHKEMAYRLLSYFLFKIGGHLYPLSYGSLERLYEKLVNPAFVGATAGRCYLKRIKGGWIQIKREERG